MLIPELIRASFCLHDLNIIDFGGFSMFQGATQRLLSVLLGGSSAVLLFKATPQAWTQVQVLVILAYPCAYPVVIPEWPAVLGRGSAGGGWGDQGGGSPRV